MRNPFSGKPCRFCPKSGSLSLEGCRSGTTLVELMVATLIGIIVFTSWLSICNPKPVVRESYRRLAVEQAAGFLDLMVGSKLHVADKKNYQIELIGGVYTPPTEITSSSKWKNKVLPVFPGNPDVPIGYTLCVERQILDSTSGWPNNLWAVVRLYDAVNVPEGDAGKPFCELKLFLKK